MKTKYSIYQYNFKNGFESQVAIYDNFDTCLETFNKLCKINKNLRYELIEEKYINGILVYSISRITN